MTLNETHERHRALFGIDPGAWIRSANSVWHLEGPEWIRTGRALCGRDLYRTGHAPAFVWAGRPGRYFPTTRRTCARCVSAIGHAMALEAEGTKVQWWRVHRDALPGKVAASVSYHPTRDEGRRAYFRACRMLDRVADLPEGHRVDYAPVQYAADAPGKMRVHRRCDALSDEQREALQAVQLPDLR